MFKAALADTPREAFNWRLIFSVVCFGLMVSLRQCQSRAKLTIVQGAARGLDEGLIGTTVTQKSFISGGLTPDFTLWGTLLTIYAQNTIWSSRKPSMPQLCRIKSEISQRWYRLEVLAERLLPLLHVTKLVRL